MTTIVTGSARTLVEFEGIVERGLATFCGGRPGSGAGDRWLITGSPVCEDWKVGAA